MRFAARGGDVGAVDGEADELGGAVGRVLGEGVGLGGGLHTFPTRRSSDLGGVGDGVGVGAVGGQDEGAEIAGAGGHGRVEVVLAVVDISDRNRAEIGRAHV